MSKFITKGFGRIENIEDNALTRKNELEDSMLKEAEDFLDRLRSSPYNRKSKVFTIEELHIEKLVSYLCRWKMLSDVLIVVWDGVSEFRDVLIDILNEKKKKRIRMEVDVTDLLKSSLKKCTEILETQETKRIADKFYNATLIELVLREAINFLQRLRLLHCNKTSKVFTDEELKIDALVNLITVWKRGCKITMEDYDVLVDLRKTLDYILSERRKKLIKMKESTLNLLKESRNLCTDYLVVLEEDREKEEETKESRDNFEGERRAEETSNGGDYPIFGEAMNFEKVKENLFIINAQKRRLLNVLAEHHHIVEAIKEEFPSPTIRSDLDKGLKSFVDHYQYLNSKLDELSAHYNGMIKQWFS